MNVLLRILRFQIQQLGDNQVCDLIIDGRADKEDVLLEQSGENIVRPFSPACLFNNDGN